MGLKVTRYTYDPSVPGDEKRARINATRAAHRAANPEQLREENQRYHRARYDRDPKAAMDKSVAWQKANPEKYAVIQKRGQEKRLHGHMIGFKERKDMNCQACGDEQSTTKHLHADHCHNTSHFRGWLCVNCNTALGSLKDDPDRIKKLLQYLLASREG